MPDYITTEEAAEILGYNVKSVRRLIRRGQLRADKKVGVWLIPREEVEEYKRSLLGKSKHDPWRPGGREKNAKS
jgi:excisionase family DNA binding protein